MKRRRLPDGVLRARPAHSEQVVGRSAAVGVSNRMDTHEPSMTELLKPAEVAARLGVSRTWLYDAASTGRIPSIRIGGKDGPLRFVPADLERWIDDARAASIPRRAARSNSSAALDLVDIVGPPAGRSRSRRRR